MNTDGESASAATAVRTGVSSPTSLRFALTPVTWPGPVSVSPVLVIAVAAPIAVSTSRVGPAGWWSARASPRTVTVPPVTRAAARNGAAADKSGWTAIEAGRSAPG